MTLGEAGGLIKVMPMATMHKDDKSALAVWIAAVA